MEITRLVHRENSDQRPDPIEAVVYSPAQPYERAVRRPRPQRPPKLTAINLRAIVEVLQLVVKHLPIVLRDLGYISSSTPTIISTNGEEERDVQRIRDFLNRTIVLTKKEHKERAKLIEYLRLLKYHHESTFDLRKLMRDLNLGDWFWMCDRWCTLAKAYYEHLSEAQCYAIAQETLQAIKTHKLPDGTKENGAFGWRDSVHLDDDSGYVRFTTRKTFDANMKQVVDHSWSIYSDGDAFKKAHLGKNCEFFHQLLQRISPDMMVVQRVEKYPNLAQLTHSLALVFRVQTETGFLIAFRCVESPQLQSLMKAEGLSLGGSFWWDTYDVAHRDEQGECDAVCYTLAGSIGSDNPTYAKRWRDEILISLVRYEIEYMDKPILTNISSAEEDAATATTTS